MPDACDQIQHRAHGLRGGDEVVAFDEFLTPVGVGEPLAPPSRTTQFDLRLQGGHKALVVPRLFNVVARATAHGFDGTLDTPPSGHRHDRQGAVHFPQRAQEIHAFRTRRRVARVVEVHQHTVPLATDDGFQHGAWRVRGLYRESRAFQQEAQRVHDVGLIVRDQDAVGQRLPSQTIAYPEFSALAAIPRAKRPSG